MSRSLVCFPAVFLKITNILSHRLYFWQLFLGNFKFKSDYGSLENVRCLTCLEFGPFSNADQSDPGHVKNAPRPNCTTQFTHKNKIYLSGYRSVSSLKRTQRIFLDFSEKNVS